MTTQTEALKLARQLLWRYRHETPIGNQPHMICQEVDEAFERIDEALAQPDQDEVDIRSRLYQRIHELETQLAQPEPEWYHVIDVHGCNRFYHKTEDCPYECRTPLYTTPPQRKPLTDEERFQLRCQWNPEIHGLLHDYLIRQTEAAHGIKGEA